MTSPTLEARLAALDLFRGLDEDDLAFVVSRGVVQSFPAGAVVWRVGDPPRGLHVMLEGGACVMRQRDGREVVAHRARPGDTLGEIPLVDGGSYPATLVVEQASRFLVLDRAAVEDLARRRPEILWRLLASLGARVRELADRLEGAAVGSVDEGLAALLLRRANTGSADGFTLGMTQADAARELGTVREVLARALSRLVDEGLLERRGRARYHIPDREALRRR